MFEFENLRNVYEEMLNLVACLAPGSRVYWDANDNRVKTDDDVMMDYDEDSGLTPDEFLQNFIEDTIRGQNNCYTVGDVKYMLEEKAKEAGIWQCKAEDNEDD